MDTKTMTAKARHRRMANNLTTKVQAARALQIKLDEMNAEMEDLKDNLWRNHNYNFTI